MQFYIGFFLPISMKINMNKRLIIGLPVLLMILLVSCEKKYQSPGQYEEDLFADERQEGKAYIMNEEECFDASELVIASSEVKLADSSKRGKPFFIYKVRSGRVLKSIRDSVIDYPIEFLSTYKLKLNNNNDSMYVYMKALQGYKFIAKDRDLRYQWLRGGSVYPVKKK